MRKKSGQEAPGVHVYNDTDSYLDLGRVPEGDWHDFPMICGETKAQNEGRMDWRTHGIGSESDWCSTAQDLVGLKFIQSG